MKLLNKILVGLAVLGTGFTALAVGFSTKSISHQVSASAGTDSLTASSFGIPASGGSSGYSDFSYTSATTGAKYVANLYRPSSSLQMRTTNSVEGIVSTTSAGTIASISVTFATNTTVGRTVDVYAKTTPYTGTNAANLFSTASTQGTKVTSFVYATGTTVYTYTFTSSYSYIGLRSNSGALYLQKADIVWNASSVIPVESISLSNDNISLSGAASTYLLSAIAYGASSSTATDQTGIWTSSNEAVATVSTSGVVTAVSAGNSIITFTSNDNTNGIISNTCSVTVIAGDTYTLVTSLSSLSYGDRLMIVSNYATKAMSITQTSTNRSSADIVKGNGTIESNSGVQLFELQPGITGKSGTFSFYTGSGYLAGQATANNYLYTSSNLNLLASFTVSLDTNGLATISVIDSNCTRNILMYNTSTTAFSCYASTTSLENKDVLLYRLSSANAATQWAGTFYLNTCDICAIDGSTNQASLSAIWSSLSSSYASLSSSDKTTILNSTGTESGTLIARAVQTYKYILNKYGTGTLNNFIGISISESNKIDLISSQDDLDSSYVIVLFGCLALFCSFGFIWSKKRHKV